MGVGSSVPTPVDYLAPNPLQPWDAPRSFSLFELSPAARYNPPMQTVRRCRPTRHRLSLLVLLTLCALVLPRLASTGVRAQGNVPAGVPSSA